MSQKWHVQNKTLGLARPIAAPALLVVSPTSIDGHSIHSTAPITSGSSRPLTLHIQHVTKPQSQLSSKYKQNPIILPLHWSKLSCSGLLVTSMLSILFSAGQWCSGNWHKRWHPGYWQYPDEGPLSLTQKYHVLWQQPSNCFRLTS